MTDRLAVLISGGSQGIGAATARLLLQQGHQVAVTGRSKERLDRLADQLNHPAALLTIAGDASEREAVESAVATTVETFGKLDVAVANAGFATHDTLADGDPTGWRDMVLTNVLGPALMVWATVPALKATQGRIILVGSVAGLVPTAGNIYGATKWAVTGLAENTRRMVTGDGIGVTLIAPGRVETPFWDGLGHLPEGQLLTADQIAESIRWSIEQPAGVDVNTVVVRPIGQPV